MTNLERKVILKLHTLVLTEILIISSINVFFCWFCCFCFVLLCFAFIFFEMHEKETYESVKATSARQKSLLLLNKFAYLQRSGCCYVCVIYLSFKQEITIVNKATGSS